MASPDNFGIVDTDIDTPDSIKAVGSQTESDLLIQRLLGIDLSAVNLRDEKERKGLSGDIAHNIFNRIKVTRVAMNQANFYQELHKNLERAIKVHDSAKDKKLPMEQLEKARLVSHAVYETMPEDISRELLAERWGFVGEKNAINRITARVDFGAKGGKIIGQKDVSIDMTNVFWTVGRFKDVYELSNELENKTIEDIGMTVSLGGVPMSPTTKLGKMEAQNIAKSFLSGGEWNVAEFKGAYREVGEKAPGMTAHWNVNINTLLQSRTTGTPPREVRDMNGSELQAYFSGMSLTDWEALIGIPGTSPTSAYPSSKDTWATVVARRVFEKLGRPETQKLGKGNLVSLQQYQFVQAQRHQVLTRAQQSQNVQGAALTASILAQDAGLAEKFPTADKKKAEKLKKDIEALNYLQKVLADFKNLQVNLTTVRGSFETVWRREESLRTTGPSGTTTKDLAKWEQDLEKCRKELEEYNRIAIGLQGLFNALNSAGLAHGTILTYVDSSTGPKKIAIDVNFNPATIASTIESEIHLDDEKKKKEDEIKKSEAGEFSGDDLQMKIFEEHLKKNNPGLSEADAKRGAKYLFGKSIADHEVQRVVSDTMDEIFGGAREERFGKEKFNVYIVDSIAKEANIPTSNNDLSDVAFGKQYKKDLLLGVVPPDWSRASYKQLCTVYFAYKKLWEDPNHRLSLYHTPYVEKEMKKIGKLLSTRYMQALIDDFGDRVPDDEKKKIKDTKIVTAETAAMMLSGDVPEKYRSKVDKILSGVEKRMYRKRDLFWNVSGKMKTGAMAVGSVVKKGTSAVLTKGPIAMMWRNKWTTAFVIGGLALGAGPILVALSAAAGRKVAAKEGGHSAGGH